MKSITLSRRADTTSKNGKAFTCHYKGCGKSFPKAQGLAMHVGRKHTNTIPTAAHGRNGQVVAAKARAAVAPLEEKRKSSLKGRPWSAARRERWEARTTSTGKPSKRKYAKRNNTQVVVSMALPNFCPIDGIRMGKFCSECGLSATDLALALHTVKKMRAH